MKESFIKTQESVFEIFYALQEARHFLVNNFLRNFNLLYAKK